MNQLCSSQAQRVQDPPKMVHKPIKCLMVLFINKNKSNSVDTRQGTWERTKSQTTLLQLRKIASFFKPKELDTLQVQVQVMEADSVLTSPGLVQWCRTEQPELRQTIKAQNSDTNFNLGWWWNQIQAWNQIEAWRGVNLNLRGKF